MPNADLRKNTVVLLALRWLLVPVLFYCFGQFLEGPVTRVVVRSLSFEVGCFVLSIIAAHFLYQASKIPLFISLLQAILIPAGYIYYAHLYYDGSKNQDYSIAIGVFFLLMMFNAAAYLAGLFSFGQRGSSAPNEDSEPVIESFEVALYALDSEGRCGRVVFQKKGGSEFPEVIILDGYSKDIHIDLKEYWDEVFAGQIVEYQTDITTYETIIKFGETQQLVDEYRLVIKAAYA